MIKVVVDTFCQRARVLYIISGHGNRSAQSVSSPSAGGEVE